MSTTTGFLYDGVNPVQEQSGGSVTATMLDGGVDEHFERTDATGSYSFLTDALGSTEVLTTSTGAEQATYTYGPYGALSITGSTTSSYDYTGRESDGLGIYYYRDRYYNPNTGRFLSEDPAGFAGSGTNLYRYAADSPINLIDPSGLANLNLLNPVLDQDLWRLANGWQPSGVYSVAAHGAVYTNGSSAGYIEGPNGEHYYPQQLAQYIMNDPNWNQQPIDLRSCSAGEGANSFAQQLANALNVPVIAPTDLLSWGGEAPYFGLFQTNWDTTTYLEVMNGGSWQTFNPER